MSKLRALALLGVAVPAVMGAAAAAESPPHVPGSAAFRATGNEPGWRLDIGASEMTLLTNLGQTRLVVPTPPAQATGSVTTYLARTDDGNLLVTITDRLCVDTMTGMPHPQSVQVTTGGQTLAGCGGDPASLLQGGEWSVVAIAGEPLVAGSQVTLDFAPDGSIAGKASCNRFVGGYKLSGEGLAITQPAGTMMMCDDALMKQEHAFLGALVKVHGFAIASDGALQLRTADGSSIEARR